MAEQLIKYAVGIDVSMDKFDTCFGEIDIRQQFNVKAKREFSNNMKGFKELEQWIKKNKKPPAPARRLRLCAIAGLR